MTNVPGQLGRRRRKVKARVIFDNSKNETYFGACSECGKNDGYLNAGRNHIFYCKEHKIKWSIGSNLFSDWKYETEEEQRAKWNAVGLEEFEDGEDFDDEDATVAAEELERLWRLPE